MGMAARLVALGANSAYTPRSPCAGQWRWHVQGCSSDELFARYLNNQQGMRVADFNGDGKLDVALTDPYDPTGSGISFGNGDGTLQTLTIASDAVPSLASICKWVARRWRPISTGDGKPDLLSGLWFAAESGGSLGDSDAELQSLRHRPLWAP